MEAAWRLWKCRKTCWEMLEDRGYLKSEEEYDLSLKNFKKKYCIERQEGVKSINESDYIIDRKKLIIETTNENGDMVIVYFPEGQSVRVAEVKEFYKMLKMKGCKHLILVIHKQEYRSQNPITSQGKRAIFALESNGYNMEHFLEQEIVVNKTKHKLVPKHVVLSDQEKTELLKRYKLTDTQLPRILKEDPIARYYGVKNGQVFKIIRDSQTSGKYVTYRIVF